MAINSDLGTLHGCDPGEEVVAVGEGGDSLVLEAKWLIYEN